MNGMSSQSWNSALAVGQEWFPYVGAVLLLLLVVAAVVLTLYLVVLLIKRIPSFIRYVWTGIGRSIKKRQSGSTQDREPIRARSGTTQHTVNMDSGAGWIARARWRSPRRQDQPLWVLLGSDSPFQLALLQGTGNPSPAGADFPEQLAWWNFRHCQVVAAPPAFWPKEVHDQGSRLMKSLDRMAPERPVEGVVVTLEVEQIRLYARQKVGDLASLIEVVASLCEASNFRLPIYLVVSDAQELRGFSEATALCGKQREAESRFTARMVSSDGRPDLDVALRQWLAGVAPWLWIELCRAEPTVGPLDRADLLHLPEQLTGLCESLLVWLSALRARTEQSPNAPIFESVIFSGASREPAEFAAAADASGVVQSAPNATALLLPGLQGLSFARPGRAQPIASALRRQQRHTRMAWAVAALVLLVVGWGVPRYARHLYADVGVIREVRQRWDGGEASRERVDSGRLSPRVAGNLIQDIYQVEMASRRRVLVPWSWGDDERELTLSVLGRQLDARSVRPRVADLLQRDPPPAARSGVSSARSVSVASADQLPAADALNAYLLSAEAVGGSLQQAEKLPSGVTYGELLKFIEVPATLLREGMEFDRMVPREVTDAFFAVGSAGNDASRQDVQRAIELSWDRLITEAIDQAPILIDADTVASLATRWSRGQPISADAVRQMSTALQRLVSEMENQGGRHIAGRPEDFAAYMGKVSARLMRSSVAPLEQSAELTARASKRREQARRRLLQYEATGVGQLFVVGEQDRLVLAPTIKPLRDSIAALQSQAFMQVMPISDLPPAPKWSQERLMPARLALQSAEEFSRSAAQGFDQRWVPSLLRLAVSQARMVLALTFEQVMRAAPLAQSYATNANVTDQSEATAIVQAVQLFRQGVPLDTEGSREQEIRARLASDLTAVLTNIEKQFRLEDPYARMNVDVIRWLRTAAPGVSLEAVLKMEPVDRLALAREELRARQLVRVEPILAAMRSLTGGAGVGDVWVAWTATQASMADYDKGTANNVLADYEQFVDRIGQLKSADECGLLMGERLGRGRGAGHLNRDMFNLRQKFSATCLERSAEASRQSYANFSNWFNERIAGRPPFGSSRTDESLTRRQVQQVLQRFRLARTGWIRADILRDEEVAQFATRMEALAIRLVGPERQDSRGGASGAVPNSGESSPDPVVKARLHLRTNPKEAVLSDQIIDAAMLIDGRRLGLQTKDLLEWRPGDPIDVVIRWASSSAYTPSASAGATTDAYFVDGRTTTFRFRGDWALFQLISRYRYPTDSVDEILLRLPIQLSGPDRRMQTGMFFMSLAAPVAGDTLGLEAPELAPALPESTRQRVTSGEEDFLKPLVDATSASAPMPGTGARRAP